MKQPGDELILGPDDDGRRLDRVLRKALRGVALGELYALVRRGAVRLNGRRARPDDRVRAGDVVAIRGLTAQDRPAPSDLRPGCDRNAIPAERIVFRSADIMVVAKLAGELTHGPDSLDDAVRSLAGNPTGGVSFRPGPLHRLDRNTSGLVIFGTTLAGAQLGSSLIRSGRLRKRYVAVVEGVVERAERWDDTLHRDERRRVTRAGRPAAHPTGGGRSCGQTARLAVRPLAVSREERLTLIGVELGTGRTHQIRAQCAAHGHPLSGDRKYGSRSAGGYLLHAGALEVDDDPGLGFSLLVSDPPTEAAESILRRFGPAGAQAIRRFLETPLSAASAARYS